MAAGAMLAPAAGAQTLSNDASLDSLSIGSDRGYTRMFPEFDPAVDRYDVAVPSGETEVTVGAVPVHGATVELWSSRAEGSNLKLKPDSITGDYTLELRTDSYTDLSIDVTAEDGTERNYYVEIDVASSEEKGWRVYNDVPMDRLVVPMNRLVDGPQLPEHYVRGLWAGDSADGPRVLTTAERHGTKDGEFYLDEKLYAFDAADSSRLPDEEFVFSGRPDAGIWSDGTTLWALDSYGTLRAYDLSDGSEITGWSVDLTPSGYYDTREVYEPRGIWSDGDTLWVTGKDDADNAKVFAFELPTKCSSGDNYCRKSNLDFELSGDNDNPWGITAGRSSPTSDVDTWWVTEVSDGGWTTDGRTIYAYNRSDDTSNGTPVPDRDIDLLQLNISNIQQLYYGLAATDTIMYVAEYITGRVYSFSMPGVSGPLPGPVSDASLKSLSLNPGTLSAAFMPGQTFYQASVDYGVTSTTVTAEPKQDAATAVVMQDGVVKPGGVVSLAVGDNTITVKVTAEDGETMRTYRVVVNLPRPSTDATLSSLTLSGAPAVDLVEAATPAGDSVTVASSLDETTVLARPTDARVESIVYKLDGNVIDPNSDPNDAIPEGDHVMELAVGANEITVEVTAEAGGNPKIYKVTVTRERTLSDIATLMSLELDNVVLSPTFVENDKDATSYTATVAHGVDETVVSYGTTDKLATVEIREGNEVSNNVVANEQDVDPHDSTIDLEVDTNTITVEVTSENGLVVIPYVVTITRAQPSNVATLNSVELDVGELSPEFSSIVGQYTATVLHSDDEVKVTYVKSDGTAKVVTRVGGTIGVDNTVSLGTILHTSEANTNNTNTVTVPMATVNTTYLVTLEVLAQDTTTTGLYEVRVTRPAKPASTDDTLGRLEVTNTNNDSKVTLDPVFKPGGDPDHADHYEVAVGNDVESIEVIAVPTGHPKATAQLQLSGNDVGTPSSLVSGQEVELEEKVNVLTIDVTPEAGGTPKTYTIEVERLPRPLPGVATLDVLELRDAARAELEFTPAFTAGDDPSANPYAVSVDNGVNRVHVTATPTDPLAGAELMVGGMLDSNGDITGETRADNDGFVPLEVGANTVRVIVAAQNGDTKTYVLTVTRAVAPPSDDAILSSLTLDVATLNFMSDKTSYDVDVGNGVTSATVGAVANSAEASLTATLGSASATSKADVTLTAPLVEGDNVIEVVVTPQDQLQIDEDQRMTNTYTITVTRAASTLPPDNSGNTGNTGNTGGGNNGGGGGGGGGSGGGGGGGGAGGADDESSTTEEESDTGSPYTDAGDAGPDTETAIEELHPLGVFTGTECEENRICPNDPLTRWVAAVWMVRLLDGEEPAAITESRFSDVNASPMWEESMWFAPHVERLAELEITVGCATDPLRYCPDGNLTRAQVASWIARAFDLPDAESAGFTDTVDSVHEDNIDSVVAAGIASGCATSPDRFCPDRIVTRGELARMVNAARKVASSG